MFGGLNRLLVTAAVAGAALVAVLGGPSAALACGGGTSAVAVYTECDQTGGGGKPAGSSGSPASHFSGPLANALSHAGKDRSVLEGLLRGYGQRRTLAASQAGSANTPSAVGSAFDLSSGPAALLAALAGTAFLLLAGTGVRFWRNRHRA